MLDNVKIAYIYAKNIFHHLMVTKKQYKCNNYRIDLYFIDYKLAIECDELQHNHNK